MARRKEEDTILRNFLLTYPNHAKLTELAKAAGTSRGKIVNALIESVESLEAINIIKFQREATNE